MITSFFGKPPPSSYPSRRESNLRPKDRDRDRRGGGVTFDQYLSKFRNRRLYYRACARVCAGFQMFKTCFIRLTYRCPFILTNSSYSGTTPRSSDVTAHPLPDLRIFALSLSIARSKRSLVWSAAAMHVCVLQKIIIITDYRKQHTKKNRETIREFWRIA